jgi:hypothetical protein
VEFYTKADLLRSHEVYDDLVSIVSAFEFLFTEVGSLVSTVTHFERYPAVKHPIDKKSTTPDFSVVFNDGVGLAGEIARFPVHDNGVDRLCSQIQRYDTLDALPGAAGSPVDVPNGVDVLLIVPFSLGTAAVKRILRDRLLSEEHGYAPSRTPCIVQYTKDSERYTFQRINDSANGRLRESNRLQGLGAWLEADNVPVRADRFQQIKASRRFGNDPIDPLYLAAHLWVTEFAELSQERPRIGRYVSLVVDTPTVANRLRTRYGKGGKKDVDRAMAILGAAQLATPLSGTTWRVAWGELARRNQIDSLLEVIAERAESRPKSGPMSTMLKTERESRGKAEQRSLF